MDHHVQIFISSVSAEFKSYRDALRDKLDRPYVAVKTQENFIPTGTPTLDKLDDYIRACDVVIHLAGDMTGEFAQASAVNAIKNRYQDLATKVPPLRDLMEASSPPLSYTQWEAYLALYHDKKLLIAVPDPSLGAQRDAGFRPDDIQRDLQQIHLNRLATLSHYPEIRFSDAKSLIIEVLRFGLDDLRAKLPREQLTEQRHNRFGKDQVDVLKSLLLHEHPVLRAEGFLLAAFVQITGSLHGTINSCDKIDLVLIDILAERDSSHELIIFAYLCEKRAGILGDDKLQALLNNWLTSALQTCQMTVNVVRGHCAKALDSLNPSNPPLPSIEIAWRCAPADIQRRVFPEAYLRWGRCRERFAKAESQPLPTENVVSSVVEKLALLRKYREIPIDRLDVFVTKDELNRPWEYHTGGDLENAEPELHPWPTVIRIHRKEWERKTLKTPPTVMARSEVACLTGSGTAVMQDVRARGIFCASWRGCESIDLDILSQVVAKAGVGFWVRSVKTPISISDILSELEGLSLHYLPRHIHERRKDSTASSIPLGWRDISVLYDPPELPSFEFSDDTYDLQHELRTLAALT